MTPSVPESAYAELRDANQKLLGGFLPTPLKNMKVNWDDYSQYMGK